MAANDGRQVIDFTWFQDGQNLDGTPKYRETYSRRDIQAFLENEHKDDEVLKQIFELIKELNPTPGDKDGKNIEKDEWGVGPKFDPKFTPKSSFPPQIISRTQNKGSVKDKKIQTFDLDPQQFKFNFVSEIEQPYWHMGSLLGMFLSLKYKAHATSTRRDFFGRMTALYGWWCLTLTKPGGDKPAMFQCTYRQENRDSPYDLFLGHSMFGVKGNEPWKKIVKENRYNLVKPIFDLDMKREWPFDESPDRLPAANGANGTRFGNCAETYPFLTFFRSQELANLTNTTYGCALGIAYFKPPQKKPIDKKPTDKEPPDEKPPDKTYHIQKAQEKSMGPCANCRKLITMLDGNVDPRLERRYGLDGAGWDDTVIPLPSPIDERNYLVI